MAKKIDTRGLWLYRTSHQIVYNTKDPVPIAEVIAALQGLEGLLEQVPKVVAGLTGIEIFHTEFKLQTLESGSLTEDILVSFFFKDKATLDAFIQKAGGNKMIRGTVIAVALTGIVAYGIHLASGGKGNNITANNNVVINIGAGELQVSPDAVKSIVETAIKASGQKEAAQNAIKFLAPARSDPTSSVSIGPENGPAFEFKAPAIAEVPKKFEQKKNDRFEELLNVEVLIRANDLDSKKSGWAGKIEGKTERVGIELDPTVSETEIFGRAKVFADVTLIFAPRGKGQQLTPAKIFIRKIYRPG